MTGPMLPLRKFVSKDFPCPTCFADIGDSCRGSAYSGRGHRTRSTHHRRVALANEANANAQAGDLK